jgi:hypothetical protein
MAAIIKTANASEKIQKTGPGGLPCDVDEYEYSTWESREALWRKRFWASWLSDII